MRRYRIRTDKNSTAAGIEHSLTDAIRKAVKIANRKNTMVEVYVVGTKQVVAQYNVDKGWYSDRFKSR